MSLRRPAVAGFTFALALAGGVSALPGLAAAQNAAQSLGGPVIAGVCLVSQEQVLGQSQAGQAATARLRQLAQTSQTALLAEQQGIEADAKTLAGVRAKLTSAQFQTRQGALQQREQALQAKAQVAQQQIEATRVKALNQIGVAAQPVIASVYTSRGCGLLLARDAVLGGNMSGDITDAVVQGLNAKMPTITFDLEPPAAPAGR